MAAERKARGSCSLEEMLLTLAVWQFASGLLCRRWSGSTCLRVTSIHGHSEQVRIIAVDTLTVDSLSYEITSQYFDSRCVFFRRLMVRVWAGARECTSCAFFPFVDTCLRWLGVQSL